MTGTYPEGPHWESLELGDTLGADPSFVFCGVLDPDPLYLEFEKAISEVGAEALMNETSLISGAYAWRSLVRVQEGRSRNQEWLYL